MTIFTKRVGANNDDVLRRLLPSYFDLTGELRAGNVTSSYKQYGGGMRFQDVTIPKDATINSAKLTITARYDSSSALCKTKIYGEAADNPGGFSTVGDYDTRRANPTTKIEWDGMSNWVFDVEKDSIDISEVIQELVNQAGWVSGNAIVIFWEDYDDRSSNGFYGSGWDYDHSAAKAVLLTVDYTEVFSGSKALSSNVVIVQSGSKNLSLNSLIRNKGISDFSLNAFIRQLGVKNLSSSAVIRNTGTPVNLSCSAILRQSAHYDIPGISMKPLRPMPEDWSRYAQIEFHFWGSNSGSILYFRILDDGHYKEGEILDASTEHRSLVYNLRELPGSDVFDWAHIARFLYEFGVPGTFYLDKIVLLGCPRVKCSVTVRNAETKDLSAEVFIGKESSRDLSCSMFSKNWFGVNLSCSTWVGYTGTPRNLSCSVEVVWLLGSRDLSSSVFIRNSASRDFSCSAIIRHETEKDLSCSVFIYHVGIKDLSCSSYIWPILSIDKPSFILAIRQEKFVSLSCSVWPQPPSASADGPSITVKIANTKGIKNVSCSLVIRRTASLDLSMSAIIRNHAAPNLPASVVIRDKVLYVSREIQRPRPEEYVIE